MNKVVHFEIPYDNQSRAQKFYQEVFGWQIMKMPDMDYHMVTTTPSQRSLVQLMEAFWQRTPQANIQLL